MARTRCQTCDRPLAVGLVRVCEPCRRTARWMVAAHRDDYDWTRLLTPERLAEHEARIRAHQGRVRRELRRLEKA